jgi:hypothetical protein
MVLLGSAVLLLLAGIAAASANSLAVGLTRTGPIRPSGLSCYGGAAGSAFRASLPAE